MIKATTLSSHENDPNGPICKRMERGICFPLSYSTIKVNKVLLKKVNKVMFFLLSLTNKLVDYTLKDIPKQEWI